MLPPGVESWNDTGNNEAFLAGKIGYTHNAFASMPQSKRDNNPVFPNIVLLRAPTANNGDSRDGGNVGGWLTIFKGAPNVDLAKKLALDLLDPANFNKMSSVAGGLFMPAYENLWTDELLAADPNFAIIKEQVERRPIRSSASRGRRSPNAGDRRHPRPGRARAVGRQRDLRAHDARPMPSRTRTRRSCDLFEEGGIMQP